MTLGATTTPWPMPPLIRASLGLHAVAAGVALAAPAVWPWVLGAVALDHAVVVGAGLWPRSRWLGPNVRQLGAASAARREIALTIDDGPDPEVTPAVLDLLDANRMRATFFCVARHAREHRSLVREIVARGHSVQNHTDVHRHDFSLLGPRAVEADVRAAQETLAELTGTRPRWFRAPAGLRNPFLQPVLHRHGLGLVSWTRRGFDTRDTDAPRVTRRLTRGLSAGDILLLHDGSTARGAHRRPVVLDVLPPLLEAIAAAGLRGVTLPQAMEAGDR